MAAQSGDSIPVERTACGFGRNPAASDGEERPLSALRDGEKARIALFLGGRGMERRMRDLGLQPGHEVEVLRGTAAGRGPVLVAIGSMRVAIGRGMADKILVTRGSPASAPKDPQ